MNQQRRKAIRTLQAEIETAVSALSDLQDQLTALKDEEQDAYDAMPEGLQAADRGQVSEAAIDALDEILMALDEFAEAAGDFDGFFDTATESA